jgi:Sigma-70 region 2
MTDPPADAGDESQMDREVPAMASRLDAENHGAPTSPTAVLLDLTAAPAVDDQAWVSGSYPGLSETCVREYPRLVRLLILYCADRDVALDLAQETMVRACLHWHKVAGVTNQRAWLTRVALNLANSRWRRIRVERRVLPTLAETAAQLQSPDIDTALAVR